VSGAAIRFLDCDSLTRGEMWWECHREGGIAYIVETAESATQVFESVKQHPSYNPNSSTLFETPGGFIFVPGFEGFEHVYTTVGQLPDMAVVDTDTL